MARPISLGCWSKHVLAASPRSHFTITAESLAVMALSMPLQAPIRFSTFLLDSTPSGQTRPAFAQSMLFNSLSE